LPNFRFDKGSGTARNAGTKPEHPEGVHQRTFEPREKLEIKRRELKRINDELRNAGSPADRRKHKNRKDTTLHEIFRLREELRAAKRQRHAPSEPGSLPSFIVIGTQKGGTTSLYNLLTRHPLVDCPALKEPHFFDRHFDEGVEWYRRHFPLPTFRGRRETITGEATPAYMFHPEVPERVAEVLPEARLIALLRNPVDRAYSHYHHQVRNGTETLSFEEAIEAEEARLREERDEATGEARYAGLNHRHFSYLSRGIYADQLALWSKFFSEEQMLVLKSEDFFERPQEILKQVLSFLGLPDWEPVASWKASKKASYERMDPATRRRLKEYFEPYNRRLYEYLGVDFGW
jgi:Sulfotransferase domain